MAESGKGLRWRTVVVILGVVVLLVECAQFGFRMSHNAKRRRLEQEGTLIQAVIKEKESVTQSRHRGQSGPSSSTTLWIRYLPDGAEDTKENLVWEEVSRPDFERFEIGQEIHAFVLGDEHYIQERSGFHTDLPDWLLLLVGGMLLVVGLAGGKASENSRQPRDHQG